MRNSLKQLLLVLLVATAGCLIEAERLPVSITGLVTEDGVAVEGASVSLLQPGTNGLPVITGAMVTGADGRYTLATDIQEERCFLVVIEVEVAGPTGAQLHFGRENAQTCGANTIDFAFTN